MIDSHGGRVRSEASSKPPLRSLLLEKRIGNTKMPAVKTRMLRLKGLWQVYSLSNAWKSWESRFLSKWREKCHEVKPSLVNNTQKWGRWTASDHQSFIRNAIAATENSWPVVNSSRKKNWACHERRTRAYVMKCMYVCNAGNIIVVKLSYLYNTWPPTVQAISSAVRQNLNVISTWQESFEALLYIVCYKILRKFCNEDSIRVLATQFNEWKQWPPKMRSIPRRNVHLFSPSWTKRSEPSLNYWKQLFEIYHEQMILRKVLSRENSDYLATSVPEMPKEKPSLKFHEKKSRIDYWCANHENLFPL